MQYASLIVTDNKEIKANLHTVFGFIKKDVKFVEDLETAQSELSSNKQIALVFVALGNRNKEEELISHLCSRYPSLPVHLLRGVSTQLELEIAPPSVAGILELPVDFTNLMSTIKLAEQKHNPAIHTEQVTTSLTGCSPEIQEVDALVRHVSQTDATVLLLGESGTGKEVVARAIHQLSPRADQPFIAVNCGAIPPELLESELFGHEKGAFTGAINNRRGRFELAEGGTLFLDEIGDMPISMQVKLLRVIQERVFERVGGMKTVKSDVRLIAATHQDLEKSIEQGKFRTDLFYRLNVFPIKLPPLRNRTSDIPLLIKEFAIRMQQQSGRAAPVVFDESAIQALTHHPLPGNVRELENLVERMSILHAGETISYSHLPGRYQTQPSIAPKTIEAARVLQFEPRAPSIQFEMEAIDLKHMLTSLEKSLISQALDDTDWVVSKAAKALSLRRTTLIQKIRKLGIRSERQSTRAMSA